MVTHPCINWAHDCLTSVIKHKTFAPCYVSPQWNTVTNIPNRSTFEHKAKYAVPPDNLQHLNWQLNTEP